MMEKESNEVDNIVEIIDQNLLKLYYASEPKSKTKYQYFDFFVALELFNKSVKKEGLAGRSDYYTEQTSKYRKVFFDLFFTPCIISRINTPGDEPSIITSEKYNFLLKIYLTHDKPLPKNVDDLGLVFRFHKRFKELFNFFPPQQSSKYFEEYIEELLLHDNISHLKKLCPLSTSLSLEQRGKLFDLLAINQFIPNQNKQNFIWALGFPNENLPKLWHSIQWNESKQGLRELLTPILGIITNQHIRDVENLFCDEKGNPFKLTKAKKNEFSGRYRDIETIVMSLNLEKKPTNSNNL